MTSTSTHVDETGHVPDLDLCKLAVNKRYKEQKLKEIISVICAMLNTNGGKIVLHNKCKCELAEHFSCVVRIVEQSMISIIGVNQTVSNISFQAEKQYLVIFVKKADCLMTTNYHLYLPSETQVVQVSPLEPLKCIKDIMNRKTVPKPLKHVQKFIKSQKCDMRESKTCNFKQLKADQSKRTTLADRMTGKSNKFTCYVSAFANYNGGQIYYGITDDRTVEGEVVSNEEDKQDIIKKVEKTINKMIWPELVGQPKQGTHWDIFFEPVFDNTTNTAIPSTFVIVIHIAACPGGVFAEEPECYEIVERKAEKMSFVAWKKKISKPVWLQCYDKIPHLVSRITWSSVEARKAFTDTHKVLMPLINNGDWEAILGKSKRLQGKPEFDGIRKLSILSKEITARFRKGRLNKAENLLEKYKDIVSKVKKDSFIFEVIGLYLEAALKRARGDKIHGLKEVLAHALSQTELIEPGVVTATVYVFAAGTVLNDTANFDYSPDVLSTRAIEHLQHVPDSPDMVNNIRKKAYFILAASHLGCSINGQRVKESVDRSSLDKTRDIIMRVHDTVLEGNPLSKYHEIQFNLVQSIYHYRHSQSNPEERTRLLRAAFKCAKETECLAKENQFPEMIKWSRANKALFTEELVRTNLLFDRRCIQEEKVS